MPTVTRHVFLHLPGAAEAVPAGLLELMEEDGTTRSSFWSYGRRYLQRPGRIAVDPRALPLDASARRPRLTPPNGLALFGAIRDATPDLWGRRVVENKLRAQPGSLPESAYIDHAGSNRPGALDVRLSLDAEPTSGQLPTAFDLDHLVDAADRIALGEPVPTHLELFFTGAPSMGGARAKAVVIHDGHQWVAKFPEAQDHFNVPLVERACLELARSAGLRVPRTGHERLADGRDVMLIERFDRGPEADGFARTHMVSALTMLGLDETERSASYSDLCRVIEQHGAPGTVQDDRTELFRRMVFNILVSNDDDHLRNHAFVYDPAGPGWRLSPLYDVVPKPTVGTERHLAIGVGARGRLATLDNAISHCAQFGLASREAADLIEELVAATRPWRNVFEAAGVPPEECDRVARAFRRAADIGLALVEREARI